MANNERRCRACGRTEAECGSLVHMGEQMDMCTECLEREMAQAEEMISEFIPMLEDMFGTPNNMVEEFDRWRKEQEAAQGATAEEADGEEVVEGEPVDKDGQPIKSGRKPASFNPFGSINIFGGPEGWGFGSPTPQKKREEGEPIMAPVPLPHILKAQIDEYVVGQELAKRTVAVAAYNHYKRAEASKAADVEIEKSNILLLGPTGTGKTYLIRTLAKLLDVPLAISDATTLTQAGYVGDDIESIVSKLIIAADGDIERAEHGIVYIDEIDKIARKTQGMSGRDIGGESVQQGLLKLLEGTEMEVPLSGGMKMPFGKTAMVNTTNILFICGGAFPGLEEIVAKRLNKSAGVGFGSELKEDYTDDRNILGRATTEDIKEYGMIPEFIGRLPIMCALDALTEEMLYDILTKPHNAIIKQYQALLAHDGVELDFDDEALSEIAQMAIKEETGARALRAIIEKFMLNVMYEVPKDQNIGKVTITGDYIKEQGAPIIALKDSLILPESTQG